MAKEKKRKKYSKYINKPAAQAAGHTLPNATPPLGKIHPFSKFAVTFELEQLIIFWTFSFQACNVSY